jgi:hypothetical protein
MAEIAWRKLALLIDADNVPPKLLPSVMAWDGASETGRFIVRRVYGNVGTLSKVAWTKLIQEFALLPVLAVHATGTKNAADMKLVIDAMDLIRERDLDGICIVSSDSDFGTLAIRIRESGLAVFGFGEAKAPPNYASAFNVFRQLGDVPPARTAKSAEGRRVIAIVEDGAASPPGRGAQMALPLPLIAGAGGQVASTALPAPSAPPAKPGKAPIPVAEILASIAESQGADGWAALNAVHQKLGRRLPRFNLRTYGYSKFINLVTAIDVVEKQQVKVGGGTAFNVRRRPTATPPA